MDFYRIRERSTKNGVLEIYPDFIVGRSTDLMVRSKSFYAIWDEEKGLWSTDEYDVQRLVDEDLTRHRKIREEQTDSNVHVRYLGDFSTNSWMQFRSYISHLSDSSHQMDEKLTFADTKVRKEDYVSKRLPYALRDGRPRAYDEIMDTLYDPQERAKLEWAIGSIIAGDSKDIQKFIVLYGPAGAGKSTFLNVVQDLFQGYYTTFEAKSLTGNSNAFSTEVFKSNPLVAIQHDGDLSRIEDNTKLNSIISHEDMTVNEKYKPSYTTRINAFLFMGTNRPVKITDAKSGIIRRLIDVQPSGRKLASARYHALVGQMSFELGEIAQHCLDVYLKMGKHYYNTYKPVEMMLQTDVFYNYIESYFDVFKEQDGVTLTQAYSLYKEFCEEANIEYQLPKFKFREELKNYFADFKEREIIDGARVRSWYSGFIYDKFTVHKKEEEAPALVLDQTGDVLDDILKDQPAQYASEYETPRYKWSKVTTTLSDLDTTKLHYVKLPQNHIVIDFDLKNAHGDKDPELNLTAASKWPTTYAEHSKSGAGIHLHYIYEGDPSKLSRVFDEGIEIKVFVGDASLRRMKTTNNNRPISYISGGLPLKEKKMIDAEVVKSEKSLRNLIERNLKKDIHPGTKPSMDFIHKILKDAYGSGMVYDLSDMLPRIIAFANNSTNQSQYCLALVNDLKISSGELNEETTEEEKDKPLVIFDVEVFPNLFVVSWKYQGKDNKCVSMINPTSQELEGLFKHNLVGFNNKKYDNHILYAAFLGYNNEQLYRLSKNIITNGQGYFREAYGLSYADIYDYSTKKQGLKKFQIELGINHQELDLPWDDPVAEELWSTVVEYCENDVVTTEQVLEARWQDLVARRILADLSGLKVNASTQQHTARILFGTDKNYKDEFNYRHLKEDFPGYIYESGKSTYKGEVTGEGGYVYSEPGYYEDVVVLDIASMHPTSMIQLDIFGKYTKNLKALLDARLAIKHGEYDKARKMFNGLLVPYLEDESDAEALAYALKISINIIYGLTAAKFDNPFRDIRNKDNIVAKRGALFMIDLKHAVQDQGFTVAHIKTDSIKIPGATPEIIEFIIEYGEKFGYTFEEEATYERFCLVNDAVYIAKTAPGKKDAHWEAVGAQFQHPYVFKSLFSKEKIEFKDLVETKSVTTGLYLDYAGVKPMYDSEADQTPEFIGRVGSFVPVKEGSGGGVLLREKDGRFYAAAGSKGYFWQEASKVEVLETHDDIDLDYYEGLVGDAIKKIEQYTPLETLVDEE